MYYENLDYTLSWRSRKSSACLFLLNRLRKISLGGRGSLFKWNKSWASLISMFHTLLQNFSLLIVWILFVVKLSVEATSMNWIITFYLWHFFQVFILNCQKDQSIILIPFNLTSYITYISFLSCDVNVFYFIFSVLP